MKAANNVGITSPRIKPLQAPAYYTTVGWFCIVVAVVIAIGYDQIVVAAIMMVLALPMFALARASRRARAADRRDLPTVSLGTRLRSVRGLIAYDVVVGAILILAVNAWHLSGSLATIFWMGGFLTTVTAAGRQDSPARDVPGPTPPQPASQVETGPATESPA